MFVYSLLQSFGPQTPTPQSLVEGVEALWGPRALVLVQALESSSCRSLYPLTLERTLKADR